MTFHEHPKRRQIAIAGQAVGIVGNLLGNAALCAGGIYVAGFRDHFFKVTAGLIHHLSPMHQEAVAFLAPLAGVLLAVTSSESLGEDMRALGFLKPRPRFETEESEAATRLAQFAVRIAMTIAGLLGLVISTLFLGWLSYTTFADIRTMSGSDHWGDVVFGLVTGALAVWPLMALIKWARAPRLFGHQ